jgi:RimJ/RimL family protein N-acetyltransferase
MIFTQTERLVIRRPRHGDAETLLPGWMDPRMTRYTGTRPEIETFLRTLVSDMQRKDPGDTEPGGPWYQFIVERRSDGLLIGDLGVGFGVPGEHQAELGYRILPEHQRQGYAREAVTALIDYLFGAHRMHRLVAVAASLNTASTSLLASLGFRQEGQYRKSFLCNDEWLDDSYFALLAEEWRAKG